MIVFRYVKKSGLRYILAMSAEALAADLKLRRGGIVHSSHSLPRDRRRAEDI